MIKKLLVFVIVFLAGLGLGAVVAHHPAPAIAQEIYASEAYISPEGGIGERIIKAINDSKVSIDLAVYNLTSQDIKVSLENAKKRGVKIRIITEGALVKDPHSIVRDLVREGFNVNIICNKDKGIMHDKFAIFDGKLLLTGSYNWTYSAQHFNYENAVFITDPDIIKQYQREFERIK